MLEEVGAPPAMGSTLPSLKVNHLPPPARGLHFSAQLERFLWDRGCAQGLCSPC